jgi:hypothetical protein
MKLTSEQKAARAEALEHGRALHDRLMVEVHAYNEACLAAYAVLQVAVEEYNTAAEEIAEEVHAIGESIRAAIDEKSERWQESDAGSAASDWCSSYEDWAHESMEFFEPDEITEPEPTIVDEIEELADATEAA